MNQIRVRVMGVWPALSSQTERSGLVSVLRRHGRGHSTGKANSVPPPARVDLGRFGNALSCIVSLELS